MRMVSFHRDSTCCVPTEATETCYTQLYHGISLKKFDLQFGFATLLTTVPDDILTKLRKQTLVIRKSVFFLYIVRPINEWLELLLSLQDGATSSCSRSSCQNSGRCMDGCSKTFECQCPAGRAGHYCERWAGNKPVRKPFKTADRNKSFQSLVFVLTQLHFDQ